MMKINCLKLASLVTMIPWHYLELCGTSSPFTLAYEGEMSIESCVLEILLSILTLKVGASTLKYLFECGAKTRTGEVGFSTRPFAPKMWATNTNRCPVQFYKCYLSKRPVAATDPDSPFYLTVNHNRSAGDPWYKNVPLGKTKLGGFMTTAAKAVGMHRKRLTNHSARKTQIQRLVDEFAPSVVAQLSRHKNLKSLDSYMTASKKQQKAMSLTLSRNRDTH